jgi:hypothetical protein
MILEAGRDTAAMFVLDELLSRAREDYLEQVLSGLVPNEGFWPGRETAALEEIKRRFYNRKVRDAVKPDESKAADAATDPSNPEGEQGDQADAKANQADFDQHGQKMTEHAIWMTHEIVKQIPYVGQEEYRGD